MLRRSNFGFKTCAILLLLLLVLCFEFFWNYKPFSFFNENRAPRLSAIEIIRRLDASKGAADVEGFPDVVVMSQPQKKHMYTNQQAREVAILLTEFLNMPPDMNQKPKLILLATPFHGMWSPDHYYALQLGMESFQRYECPFKNCIVTNDKGKAADADAVVFHLRDIKIDGFQLPRKSSQKWILQTLEPPWLELVNLDMMEGVFNWTMSYREDSDIVVRYGFIGPHRPSLEANRTIMPPFEHREKAAVWFVSDCCTQSGRENYVRELKKYIKVDVFGGCGKDVCRPAETSACYENVMNKYLFYIAFENAICKDYVTEKFFNILNYDVVPVVFGGARYRDIAPPHSYIDTSDFPSPKALATFLRKLADNESLYRTYFAWKDKYRSYMHAWSCDLCKKLHLNASIPTIKMDLKQWFLDDAQCQRWTKNGFVQKHFPVFPCYKTKIF